jgi:transposase
MAKLIWPANSPDLNPIETLWKIVKDLLRHCPRPKNKEEMAQTIQSTWDTISLEQLQTLILRTMPDRMQTIILARGSSIRW